MCWKYSGLHDDIKVYIAKSAAALETALSTTNDDELEFSAARLCCASCCTESLAEYECLLATAPCSMIILVLEESVKSWPTMMTAIVWIDKNSSLHAVA